MKEQLTQYVSLLFAGAENCEDIQQEILQNTLDRYDDLIAQGKSPESAYRLAIMGIGDISEILSGTSEDSRKITPPESREEPEPPYRKPLRAIAVFLFILCPVPLFIFDELDMDTLGLCGTLFLAAAATALIILSKKAGSDSDDEENKPARADSPREQLHKSIGSLIWTLGLCAYFLLSFLTGAWHITWVIFPLTAAIQGLIRAVLDLTKGE